MTTIGFNKYMQTCLFIPALTFIIFLVFSYIGPAVSFSWFLTLPIATIFGLFAMSFIRKRGVNISDTVIPIYEVPDKISPLEAGILIDQKLHDRDMSAQLIHYARVGILNVKLQDGNYILELNKDLETIEEDFNKQLLETIFEEKVKVRFREVKESMMDNLIKLNNFTFEISNSLIKKGYYKKNLRKQRGDYNMYGLCTILASFFVVFYSFSAGVGLFLSGIILIVGGKKLPLLTKKGALLRRKVLGLKDYIEVAEQDRIEFHSDPAKNPDNFQKFLPLAMAFGLEKKWAHKIRESNTKVESDIPWFDSSDKTSNIEKKAEEIGNINSKLN